VFQNLVEVLTVVNVEITIFCDMTPYNLVDRYQRFRETFYLHLPGRSDGGRRFLRNVSVYPMASHLRR
jgi:hypothetical protein